MSNVDKREIARIATTLSIHAESIKQVLDEDKKLRDNILDVLESLINRLDEIAEVD